MTRGKKPKRRLGARQVVMGGGVLLCVGLPLLVLGAQSSGGAANEPVGAGKAAPPAKKSPEGKEGARAQYRVPMKAGIAAAQFDCKPVRKDESVAQNQYPVPLPPFSKDIFPCTRCHDKPQDFNTAKRKLTLEHTHIKLVHGPREQWCYGCHNPTNRDRLRLAGGRTVSFQESYELCGQCHGPKLRDWRLGIHGRRTGCWNGKRQYLLCVHCHSPHAPKFPPLKPMPRPKKPTEL